MDPPAFEDRHPLLDPQQWSAAIDLAEQKPRPAAIARGGGEQLGEGGRGHIIRPRAPSSGQPPAFADDPHRLLMARTSGIAGPVEAARHPAAGHQGKT